MTKSIRLPHINASLYVTTDTGTSIDECYINISFRPYLFEYVCTLRLALATSENLQLEAGLVHQLSAQPPLISHKAASRKSVMGLANRRSG